MHDDRADITIHVAGHVLPDRDTAEIVRILAVFRELGFVPLAEYTARPHVVPHDQRRLPGRAVPGPAPPDEVAPSDSPDTTRR